MKLAIQSVSSIEAVERAVFLEDLQEILQQCLDVDADLRRWPLNLPGDYDYVVKEDSAAPILDEGLFYSGTVHIYNSLRHATAWNRWRGCRLIINKLMSKMSAWVRSISDPESASYGSDPRLAETRTVTRQLADDICASVPFHFGVVSRKAFDVSTEDVIADVAGAQVYPLVWPCTLTSVTPEIPDVQRRFVKNIFSILSQVTGSGTLQILSTVSCKACRLAVSNEFVQIDLHKHIELIAHPGMTSRNGK